MKFILMWLVFIFISIATVVFIYAICISISDAKKRRANRKRGNLHFTVNKGWENRFKNKKN